MLLEDNVDGLEIELLGQVQDRQVFVVEFFVLVGRVPVPRDQVLEIFAVGVEVAFLVHRHEAVELDEAGINATAKGRIRPRYRVDHVRPEPCERLVLGQLVGDRRRQTRVNGRSHEGHGGGAIRVLVLGHQGAGGQYRRSRLTDADDVGARADDAQHGADVVDIVRKIEPALEHRHLSGIDPVGDIDVVVLNEGLDRAAQQGGIVAGQRGHDQHGRRSRGLASAFHITDVAREPDQTAPGRGPDDLFGRPDGVTADVDGFQPPHGLTVASRDALEQLGRGEGGAAKRRVGRGIEGRTPELAGHLGPEPERRRRVVGELVKRIQHACPETAPAGECRAA